MNCPPSAQSRQRRRSSRSVKRTSGTAVALDGDDGEECSTNGEAAESSAQSVELRRVGQYLTIRPAMPELAPVYHTIKHIVGDEGKVVAAPFPLLNEDDYLGQRRTWGYAGLEPIVQELLEKAGYQVRLVGHRPEKLPVPDRDSLKGFRNVDVGALTLIRQHDRGLIRYDPGHVQPYRLIAQIAKAWPKKRIIVTATRCEVARQLHGRLQQFLPKVTVYTGDKNPHDAGRVTVATYACLGLGPIGIERRDIYIAHNPAEVLTNEVGREGLKHLARARVYGLLADHVPVSPYERGRMTSLFGLEDVYLPGHGERRLPVDVLFTHIKVPPIRTDDLQQVRRRGIWLNHIRNRRLAKLAKAAWDADLTMLAGGYRNVTGVLERAGGGRVGMIVDSVDHGLEMAGHLHGWPLVAGEEVCMAGLSPEQIDVLNMGNEAVRAACPSEPTIVTPSGLARAGKFDIIIRADGNGSLLPLPREHLIERHEDRGRLVIVDCDDRHHYLLRRWTRERRQAYLRVGFDVAGEVPKSPLDRFVADRPDIRV